VARRSGVAKRLGASMCLARELPRRGGTFLTARRAWRLATPTDIRRARRQRLPWAEAEGHPRTQSLHSRQGATPTNGDGLTVALGQILVAADEQDAFVRDSRCPASKLTGVASTRGAADRTFSRRLSRQSKLALCGSSWHRSSFSLLSSWQLPTGRLTGEAARSCRKLDDAWSHSFRRDRQCRRNCAVTSWARAHRIIRVG
jgi:hypothetical protein